MNDDEEYLTLIREDNKFYLDLHGDDPSYQYEYSMTMNRRIEFLLKQIGALQNGISDIYERFYKADSGGWIIETIDRALEKNGLDNAALDPTIPKGQN